MLRIPKLSSSATQRTTSSLISINNHSLSTLSSASSTTTTLGLLRPTQPLLAFVMNPEKMKQAAAKNRSVYGDIDPDRLRQFEDMQMGMTKKKIEQERKDRADFLALPIEEQIRRFMLSKRKFDVDLVRKNGMNVAEEFDRFKQELKKMDRAANRGFWIPIIVSTTVIWGGSSYWVFNWY